MTGNWAFGQPTLDDVFSDMLADQIVCVARLWAGNTAAGMAEAERILADSAIWEELDGQARPPAALPAL